MEYKSMIEVAKEIFNKGKKPLPFNDLFEKVTKELKFSEDQKKAKIGEFYVDLLKDGCFFFNKDTKKWFLKSLSKIEIIKRNQIDIEALEGDDDSEDEESPKSEEDIDFDDVSMKELKKNNASLDEDDQISREVEEEEN